MNSVNIVLSYLLIYKGWVWDSVKLEGFNKLIIYSTKQQSNACKDKYNLYLIKKIKSMHINYAHFFINIILFLLYSEND